LIIELLLFFGVVALVKPITVNIAEAANALFFLAVSITLMMFWMNKKELTWKHGMAFLALYSAFLAIEIYKII
jgi:Ca2+/Na+ antiporter